MASFICTTEKKSFFVNNEAYGFKAAMRVANLVPKDTKIYSKPINRFITIYGEYIDLEGGDINDRRPIQITEKDADGNTVVYAKEFGLKDANKLYAIA